jgi:hypothetical protein
MMGFSLEGYQKGVWNTTLRKKPGIVRFSLSMEDEQYHDAVPLMARVSAWWRIGFLIPGVFLRYLLEPISKMTLTEWSFQTW